VRSQQAANPDLIHLWIYNTETLTIVNAATSRCLMLTGTPDFSALVATKQGCSAPTLNMQWSIPVIGDTGVVSDFGLNMCITIAPGLDGNPVAPSPACGPYGLWTVLPATSIVLPSPSPIPTPLIAPTVSNVVGASGSATSDVAIPSSPTATSSQIQTNEPTSVFAPPTSTASSLPVQTIESTGATVSSPALSTAPAAFPTVQTLSPSGPTPPPPTTTATLSTVQAIDPVSSITTISQSPTSTSVPQPPRSSETGTNPVVLLTTTTTTTTTTTLTTTITTRATPTTTTSTTTSRMTSSSSPSPFPTKIRKGKGNARTR
ncbi:hypothetical protein HK102_001328, partial [Quaeritorhiza haematococci]